MPVEHLLGVAGAIFLSICGIWLVASISYGRRLTREFEERLPEQYAKADSPWPGYFNSQRRHAYFRFLMRREYETLTDPYLVRAFTKLRRAEVALLVFIVAGFVALGLAFVWLEFLSGS